MLFHLKHAAKKTPYKPAICWSSEKWQHKVRDKPFVYTFLLLTAKSYFKALKGLMALFYMYAFNKEHPKARIHPTLPV